MKHEIYRVLDALLTVAIFILAIDILLIMYTGEAFCAAGRLHTKPLTIYFPIILLLLLVILRFPLRDRAFSREVFFSHGGTIIFSVCLIIYLASGCSTLEIRDTLAARYLPLSILRDGNFYLDAFPFLYAGGTPYYLRIVNGHYVSDYPIGAALLALPFYLPSAFGRLSPENPFFGCLERLSAAAIVALSVVLLYFTLRRLTSRRMALLITVAYALGTSSLSTSSRALWQHGPSQLALTATLWCLVAGRGNSSWVAIAGFPLALAVISRPTNFVSAIPLGAYVLLYHRRQIWGFLLSGLPPALFLLWYNAVYFGNPLRTQFPILASESWSTPFWHGLAGTLVSPCRGLFIYSPVFLFSVAAMALAWRRNGQPLLRCLSVGVLLTIALYSKWKVWWGGWCYGPRLLADLSPLLALSLYPLDDLLQKNSSLRKVFILCVLWSVGAHATGAFWSDPAWNFDMDVDRFPQLVWSWTNNQMVNPPRQFLNRVLVAVRRLPTSRTAPERLSAAFHVDLPQTVTIPSSQPIPMVLTARNVGEAVWLAWPRRASGSTELVWHWLKEGREISGMSGEFFLLYDVLPGQSHDFWTRIWPPSQPGTYRLELGLVTESAAAHLDHRSLPVQLTVTVLPDQN